MVTLIKQFKSQNNKAFTLFVSMLVASLLLAVGFSIGNIIVKQLRLSASGGGSQVAFYAADSASECALFWDRKDGDGESVGESPFSPISSESIENLHIVCGSGQEVDGGGLVYGLTKVCNTSTCGPSAVFSTTTFYVDFKDRLDEQYKGCARVTIAKKYDAAIGSEETIIDTKGYNTDLLYTAPIASTGYSGSPIYSGATDVRCDLNRQRVVERGLLLSY